MASILGGDNSYAGGLSFANPSFSITGGSAAINGGLSFDLPLATIAAFSAQGISAQSKNSAANREFLANQFVTSGNIVERSSVRSVDFLQSNLSAVKDQGAKAQDAIVGINNQSQQMSLFRTIFAPKQAKGGSSCYITTAICELENKPDNCEELETFRRFRDVYMLTDKARMSMVGEYYQKAPRIVERIKALPDGGRSMFMMLNRQYLRPAFDAIKEGKFDSAMNIYVHMVAMADDLTAVEA